MKEWRNWMKLDTIRQLKLFFVRIYIHLATIYFLEHLTFFYPLLRLWEIPWSSSPFTRSLLFIRHQSLCFVALQSPIFVLVSFLISIDHDSRAYLGGGSWGARDPPPPLCKPFFKQTTYNIPWRKHYDDIVWYSVTPAFEKTLLRPWCYCSMLLLEVSHSPAALIKLFELLSLIFITETQHKIKDQMY